MNVEAHSVQTHLCRHRLETRIGPSNINADRQHGLCGSAHSVPIAASSIPSLAGGLLGAARSMIVSTLWPDVGINRQVVHRGEINTVIVDM